MTLGLERLESYQYLKLKIFPERVFWRNLQSKSGIRYHRADFEGWQLCNLSTYKVIQYLFGKISSITI